MTTDIWSIPRDPSTGAVCGSYYLRHAQSDLSATLGVVRFEAGRSVRALTGRELVSYVAALGADLSLEPADDAARAAMGAPVAVSEKVAAVAATPASEASAEAADAAEVSDDLESIDDIEALRAIALGLGIEDAVRWQHKRVRAAIRKARGDGSPTSEAADAAEV